MTYAKIAPEDVDRVSQAIQPVPACRAGSQVILTLELYQVADWTQGGRDGWYSGVSCLEGWRLHIWADHRDRWRIPSSQSLSLLSVTTSTLYIHML
jgi:hypothetical protein